jgi:malonate-semialdehyde dehydrogenase (acetylating) / methylmalonate-semialdehyde dehydrogenase
MDTITHWIDNTPTPGTSQRFGPVYNPAIGIATAQVPLASVSEVDRAVASARDAFPEWRDTPLAKRQRILFTYREILVGRARELAEAITREHGKTFDDASGEVQRGLEVVEYACALPELLKGSYSEQISTGVDMYNLNQPLGVTAGITPFNFPAMVPMWMFPMAIACGNTFVLKPSEKDPSASMLAAEMFADAGLPPGVLNVVHGDKVAVDRLLEHPDIAAVSFVGSTPIAQYVHEQASRNHKRVQALGGAKNHMIVLPDADMDLAADSAVSAGYGSAGERCMAISVVVAVGDAADKLVPRIVERASTLKVGPGMDPESEMGPLVTGEHRDRVAGYIAEGAAAGAELTLDGRSLSIEEVGDGFFLGATLFDHVKPDMSIYRDEIFGPVLSVVRVDSYQEAIDLINANQWGNGTAVFTNDGGAARKFQNEIQVGMVGINVPIPVPFSFYSFGGWKDSMFGDHDIYGPHAVSFYTRSKTVITRWPDPIHRGVDLGFPTAE